MEQLKSEASMETIKSAIRNGQKSLSEFESKQVLSSYGIPTTREIEVASEDELGVAANNIGYPLVLKGSSSKIAHKTEKGLIHIDIRNKAECEAAYREIVERMEPDGRVLVQEMIDGERELVAGMTRDQQFGPCVMFGLGGIFTEILKDVSFRVAPINKKDALDMMMDIRSKMILEAVRGLKPVDKEALADILIKVGQIGIEHAEIAEIDINPLIIKNNQPVAVDALIVLK
jgi:acetyl-CoA synthetase (ADP-forming)